MRHRIAAMLLFILPSCASPQTAAQTVFALEAGYDAALQAMHAEGRDPTDAEWAALTAAGEAALARLDAASA